MKVIIRYWMGGAGVVTDQQVVFTEAETNGKKDTADIGGHGRNEHTVSAQVAVWTLPSETGEERWWRTRTDPFDGVWEEEILPLLQGEAAGRLRATTIIE